MLLGQITWLVTKIKPGVVHCKYSLNQSPYSGKFVVVVFLFCFFLQKNLSPVAAHPYQSIDKCGGEIAKLATSSQAIETSKEKTFLQDACHRDTIQITTIRHAYQLLMNVFLIQFSLKLFITK